MYRKYVKRLLDIICALATMVVFCWLYAIIAILVRVKLGSPVLFMQERPGLNERIFKLYKFRTMTDERNENGELLPDEARLTKFGRWLRSTSLDELPEAINILKGDMSVVGPRPLLAEYLPWYTVEERHRHDIRPGLTGWAQVNGRNVTPWDERLQQDIYYVERCSLELDFSILVRTILKVVKRSDILMGDASAKSQGRLDDYRKNTLVKMK